MPSIYRCRCLDSQSVTWTLYYSNYFNSCFYWLCIATLMIILLIVVKGSIVTAVWFSMMVSLDRCLHLDNRHACHNLGNVCDKKFSWQSGKDTEEKGTLSCEHEQLCSFTFTIILTTDDQWRSNWLSTLVKVRWPQSSNRSCVKPQWWPIRSNRLTLSLTWQIW